MVSKLCICHSLLSRCISNLEYLCSFIVIFLFRFKCEYELIVMVLVLGEIISGANSRVKFFFGLY